MNIAIVNAVFLPEPVVSARLGAEIAAHLSSLGHRVTVFCPAPSRPRGARYASVSDGQLKYRVVRVPSLVAPESRLIGRLAESFSFGRHVCRALTEDSVRYDVVYANSWPMLSQALLAQYCRRRGIPFVYHIQDLYPEALLPRLPRAIRNTARRVLMGLERWTVARTAHIIVVGEGMRRVITSGSRGRVVPPITTIHNWQDDAVFNQPQDRAAACRRYDVDPAKKTFLFLGNIGRVAGVEEVMDGFAASSVDGAQLVFFGEGTEKAACMRRAATYPKANILFRSDPDVKSVPVIQSMADVCVLPMRGGTGIASIPSKLIAYMLSAKPVLAIVDGNSDTAEFIDSARCGWVVSPGNREKVSELFRSIDRLPETELRARGSSGAAYAARYFNRTQCLSRMSEVILGTAMKGAKSGV